MEKAPENFIPILFNVLFGFVALNIVVNLILVYTRRIRINKLLAIFWPMMLIQLMVQGMFQDNHLNIILGYSTTVGCCLIAAMIGFEAVGRKFPLKNFLAGYALIYPLTIWIAQYDTSFSTLAMPFALATAAPLFTTAYFLNVVDRQKTTRLQKVLGIIYCLNGVHCINFAIFRMDPGAQLWGWFVTYALADFLAIVLPSIALELAKLTENERLQQLVDERTTELNKSLQTNDNLFKVLVHDISNPLMVLKGYLYLLKENPENHDFLVDRMQKSQSAMENIIKQVKSIYRLKSKSKLPLEPVSLEECFKEITFIFEQTLKRKNVNLKLTNNTSKTTNVLADQVSFTHSVLSNLVSNAIKFTPPHSQIELNAYEKDDLVIVEVSDEGPGIPTEVSNYVHMNIELMSTQGTQGEKGTGLGLSIVKSFVDAFGGKLEFISKYKQDDLGPYGTLIRLTLKKAEASPVIQPRSGVVKVIVDSPNDPT